MPDDALLTAARRLADELLRPAAERVDAVGVPRAHLDALGAAGLFGVAAPVDAGGHDLPPATLREVAEVLAAADASTWFVWTQHHTPVRTLVRGGDTPARARLLSRLAAGALVAGVAYTHLRRPGPAAVVAERTGAGWRLSGRLDWVTSWSLADVFCVAAQHGDDVVWALLPLPARPGVTAEPLALAAMNGTSTVAVRLAGVEVRDDEVALVEPLEQWRAADAARTADVGPAVFGVTDEAVRRLRVAGVERDLPAAVAAADALGARLADIRAAAYALADTAPPGERTDERLALRARAHRLALDATAALVASGGGRAMALDAAAQRLARVALFLLVQGQTGRVRAATLADIAGR